MLESGRLLHFPTRIEPVALYIVDAKEAAREYLSTPVDQRSDSEVEALLSNPDVLSNLCTLLREMWETAPATAAEESGRLYLWIGKSESALRLFDERDYFLGETALIAGTAYRFIGKLDEAERWFDRAEAGFRHTINSAPLLANLSYARLAHRYVLGRYRDVLELLPSLILSFRKFGMELEASKCRFLEAKTLMNLGMSDECLPVLDSLRMSPAVRANRVLLGHVLFYAGNCQGTAGRFEEASSLYEEALPVVQGGGPSSSLAQLKWSIGDTYRSREQLVKAVEAYRGAQKDFISVTMPVYVALLHLVIAETLLALGRHREAEWEILAALPTIEEQKMVPEGFAAFALLKESVRLRKTDSNALRELREQLQTQK
jgi:tetratricopeptide (TPR) repeat protein